jgi:hypothetical protein
MKSKRSNQEEFAENLNGHCRGGIALYHPLEYRPGSKINCVGDIAFFDSQGNYNWIHNAFDSLVLLHRVKTSTNAITFSGFGTLAMASIHGGRRDASQFDRISFQLEAGDRRVG